MKTLLKFKVFFVIVGVLSSCSSDFLDEKPLDFLTTNNAFETLEDFDASINNLYNLIRYEFYLYHDAGKQWMPAMHYMGTDLTLSLNDSKGFGDYNATLDPTGAMPTYHWNHLYKIVAESNTILSRFELSGLGKNDKILIEAKAKFFRGMAYRTLTYLFGGVPLILEEVTTVKTDFTRSSRKEVYGQVIADLEFASENLPGISQVRDGEVSSLAASHLLAEVYIANEQYDKAIAAATDVIDNPSTALMTERFGRRINVPGDVYWDLFQKGNQNRTSGNTEGIWVMQFETDVPGGSTVSSSKNGGFRLERINGPYLAGLILGGESNPIRYPTSNNTGGRGIAESMNLKYYTNTIWESDFNNDIRNSKYNFIREFECDNPSHPWYGQTISTEDPPEGISVPTRELFAFQAKITTPGDHPDALYEDKEIQLLKTSAGVTYADQYMFRLAETYLLRAEAYLRNGDPINAAGDINIIRNRADASEAEPGDITIDYILDERMRELGIEEKRRLTLMRMGKLDERILKCQPSSNLSGYSTNADEIQPYHELWPIPFSAIEANTNAKLEQNPGYYQ